MYNVNCCNHELYLNLKCIRNFLKFYVKLIFTGVQVSKPTSDYVTKSIELKTRLLPRKMNASKGKELPGYFCEHVILFSKLLLKCL